MAYHKSREAFSAGFSIAGHIYGTENSSNILTKLVSPSEFYEHTVCVIFGII